MSVEILPNAAQLYEKL